MFLNIKIIYKRLVITFIITFLIGCKSVSVDSEKVIEIYFNEVLSQSVLKRVQDHGIVLKEYDDYSWFINFMKNDPFKKNGVLENTKDSITREFFYQKNRDYYIKQFNSKKNKINKLNYNIEKLAMFSGSLKEKLKTSNHITFHISKPIFSLDKKKAIIFSSNSHEPKIYLFLKMDNPNAELGAWKLHKVYNSLFSNLNY